MKNISYGLTVLRSYGLTCLTVLRSYGLTRLTVLIILLFFGFPVHAQTVPVSKKQFAAQPFGMELTLLNFENHYKKTLKRQRYFIQNMANSAQTDTIYQFYKGKTKILFYKPMKLEARIMGGTIRKPEVELINGIRVGLTRKEFFEKFADWPYDESDSLTLESPATGCNFTFVFSRGQIKEIKIAGKQTKDKINRLR